MKPPKHSKAAISAHPAPDIDKFADGAEYAEACRLVSEARIAFDAPKLTTAQRLDAIGIDVICDHVASGESLRSWSVENNLPNRSVNDWIEADVYRSAHYACARDERADVVFDSLDDVSNHAVTAETAVEVAGLRLKSDNIKWKLARMNAKKYGDKIQHGGADDLPAIKQEHTHGMATNALAMLDMIRGKNTTSSG